MTRRTSREGTATMQTRRRTKRVESLEDQRTTMGWLLQMGRSSLEDRRTRGRELLYQLFNMLGRVIGHMPGERTISNLSAKPTRHGLLLMLLTCNLIFG